VELRQTLLYRNGRGVELTPAGQCFLEHGQGILQTVTRALGALSELRTDPRGRVVIGLPSRVARLVTTPLVKAFRAKFPSAAITIAEGLSSVLHEWLLLGRVDLALLVDPPRSAELELELLHSEELVLVGLQTGRSGVSREIALRQIEKYPLILPRIPNATRSVLEAAVGKAGGRLHVLAEVDTSQNILELVAGKVGYAVLPRGAVRSDSGAGRFRISEITPHVRQHLFLAVSKRRPDNRLAGEVRRLIREVNVPALVG
jgi:LysR family nitrogen assimilation transcriptional regulator